MKGVHLRSLALATRMAFKRSREAGTDSPPSDFRAQTQKRVIRGPRVLVPTEPGRAVGLLKGAQGLGQRIKGECVILRDDAITHDHPWWRHDMVTIVIFDAIFTFVTTVTMFAKETRRSKNL
jgi:hypothetical protein